MVSYRLNQILQDISTKTYKDERDEIKKLLEYIELSESQLEDIEKQTLKYINKIKKSKISEVEQFIHEYSLSSEEGVAVMCLAEALLRIPDKKTAIKLIKEKLRNRDWKKHLRANDSLFVNASTWGLLITGKFVSWQNSNSILSSLFGKLSNPIIYAVIQKAIKLISNEFIMGKDLKSAFKNVKYYFDQGYCVSFDILGESSRTMGQADYYYQKYLNAILWMSKEVESEVGELYNRPNISIKLTALHPKVYLRKKQRLQEELLPKLIEIIRLCKKANITVSFDAEESFRQDIYLSVLQELCLHEEFKDYAGIGFVVQAYQKRAFYIIDYIAEIARISGKTIPVRLVKGAYWDSEIKYAQENGLEGYPVFTQKEFTDVAYLACAQKILKNKSLFYPQFATHNAFTVAAIKTMAGGLKYEFQKLQGMGNALHKQLIKEGFSPRIYAPVGKYEDLLAYLMRRLLENGANNSFVNLVASGKLSKQEIVVNPLALAKKSYKQPLKICLPQDIYGTERKNSEGYELGVISHLQQVEYNLSTEAKRTYEAYSIISGKKIKHKESKNIVKPANNQVILGKLYRATNEDLKNAADKANAFFEIWSNVPVMERARIIVKVGELLYENRFKLYSLLIKEAGKNINDAISSVREAIDFANYYAARANYFCAKPVKLPGYTGEINELSLHPKGIFVCISPWNFPLAIFAGQIFAALVTGNTVIAKPSESTSLIATYVVELMHKAGIPKDALHLVIVSGKSVSENLLTDDRVKGVCLTGSMQTAVMINRQLAARDTAIATFIAETGGQNAMIIDSSALLEQATDFVIHSAFGSIGQRCSALRVLYIQEEIFKPLLDLIIGAMVDIKIGDTEDLSVDLGPVISLEAKTGLEQHISNIEKVPKCKVLAVKPIEDNFDYKNGNFFMPHVVQISSIYDLKKENFGPILHVMPYKSVELDKVIEEINRAGYGLTFGLQTRLEERIHYIASRVKVGNFYANRTMIGAQVGTHPFGGENNSGTGFKAGGPYYLLKFLTERTKTINTTAIGGNLEILM